VPYHCHPSSQPPAAARGVVCVFLPTETGGGWPVPRTHTPLVVSVNSKHPVRCHATSDGNDSSVEQPATSLGSAARYQAARRGPVPRRRAEEALAVLRDDFIRVLIVDVVLPGPAPDSGASGEQRQRGGHGPYRRRLTPPPLPLHST